MDKKDKHELLISGGVVLVSAFILWLLLRNRVSAQPSIAAQGAATPLPSGSLGFSPYAQSPSLNLPPLTFNVGGNSVSLPGQGAATSYGGSAGGGGCGCDGSGNNGAFVITAPTPNPALANVSNVIPFPQPQQFNMAAYANSLVDGAIYTP